MSEVSEETSNAPEVSQETSNAPEVSQETSNAPEVSQETTNTSEVSEESSSASEVSQETSNTSEVSQETSNTSEVSQETSNTREVSQEGSKLVELFSVNLKSERPWNLYGTVRLETPSGCQFIIYQKEREDSEPINAGSSSLWTGLPDIPVLRNSWTLSLEVDLKHRDENADASSDTEVCKGLMHWDFDAQGPELYDKHLSDTVIGKNGSVEVCYAVYNNAVTAHIWVKLTQFYRRYDGKSMPTRINGRIIARNTCAPNATKILFDKKGDEAVDIPIQKDERGFVLCKCVVAAPLSSKLHIHADLNEYNKNWNWSSPIAKGTCKFAVQGEGESAGRADSDNFCTDDCCIDMVIFWRSGAI